MNYSSSEYADMVQCLDWAGGNAAHAARRYSQLHPQRNRFPSARVIECAARRLRETGDILPHRGENGGPQLRQRNPARENAVLAAFNNDPCTSSRCVGRELNMSHSTVNLITRTHGLRPFHLYPVQELHEGDPVRRANFSQFLVEQYEADPEFIEILFVSDESNFNQSGVRNCHNEHYYDHKNPHVIRSRSHQIRFNMNIWAGMVGRHVVGT